MGAIFMPGVESAAADDWPPPLEILSQMKKNSNNEWAFSKAIFSGKALENLEGIEKFESIVDLDLSDNSLTSLAELSALPGIRRLVADGNAVADLTGISDTAA